MLHSLLKVVQLGLQPGILSLLDPLPRTLLNFSVVVFNFT